MLRADGADLGGADLDGDEQPRRPRRRAPDRYVTQEDARRHRSFVGSMRRVLGLDEGALIEAPEDELAAPCGGCGARPGETCTDDCPTRAMEDPR